MPATAPSGGEISANRSGETSGRHGGRAFTVVLAAVAAIGHSSYPRGDTASGDVVQTRFATSRWRALGVLATLWLFLLSLGAGSTPVAAAELYSLIDFAFEDGSVLPDLRIAYETKGTLS